MRDLQQRLLRAGGPTDGDDAGTFGPATTSAVEQFQRRQGLLIDGVVGAETWAALVESGYRLGDRLLYVRRPMLRGDDVAELQRRLGSLGFDAGRIDGIFGADTAQAMGDFQRNAGLTDDGICGRDSVAALERLSARADPDSGVAHVRELEALRHRPPTLQGQRLALGQPPELDALVVALSRALRLEGAHIATLRHSDGSAQAQEANRFNADAYVGLVAGEQPASAWYYATAGFTSEGGRSLARAVLAEVAPALGQGRTEPEGMRLPVLRETRMPAVVCRLGPPSVLTERTAVVAAALCQALVQWAKAPVEPSTTPGFSRTGVQP